jgi:hypothetical protein
VSRGNKMPKTAEYRPRSYRMEAQQALAILLELGVPRSEAMRRINGRGASQQAFEHQRGGDAKSGG